MSNNKFNFFVGLDIDEDIFKAATKAKGDDRYKNMILLGKASDSSKDVEGEMMEPEGFQIDEFLKSGYINLEHYTSRKGSSKYWIGEPIDAYVKNNEFFVKSKLWEHHPLARDFWDTVLIMKASGSTRKPGYSIEGKALERHPLNKKRVTKARISNCAVTFNPVNKNSFLDIVKGEQKEDFIENKFEELDTRYVFEFEKGEKIFGITKDFKIEEKKDEDEEEKAVDTANTEGLRKESVDGKVKCMLRKGLRSGKISPKKAYNFIKSFYK